MASAPFSGHADSRWHCWLAVCCATRAMLLVLAVQVGLPGCSSRSGDTPKRNLRTLVYLRMNDPVPPCDLSFTWEDYEPQYAGNQPQAEEIVQFIIDGKPIGRGKVAFGRIIQRISELRQGARVLVYPSYDIPDIPPGTRLPRDYPFMQSQSLFNQVLDERGITLVFSPRDPQGKIHPECEDDYTRWKQLSAGGAASMSSSARSQPESRP